MMVKQFELKSFSQSETISHFRAYFPSVTDNSGVEFHRLTGGNPRVQANACTLYGETVANILTSLGPSLITVESQIAAQLESAIDRTKSRLSTDFQDHIDAICTGLSNLTPFIPINVLAVAAGVEPSAVVSFVSDMGRPLWISENSVQFRDEPTETWFRDCFSASKCQIESYIARLKPFATDFAYVAQVLPSLLLQAENYDELITLALSDDYLPKDSPIDKRNIRVYRLQFALKAALKQMRYADAAKLALRAGEEVAGDKRQLNLLTQNVDLIAPLLSQQRVQELAFRRMLRGDWNGSENAYSASLLSSVKDFKGEASSFLRSATNWLTLYFDDVRKDSERINHENRLSDNEIMELAFAYFHIYGIKAFVDFISRWTPPEVIFRISRLFIKRLVDAGEFKAIEEISQVGGRNQYLMIAISDELIKVGKFLPIDLMRECLDLLVHRRTRISKPTEYSGESTFSAAIISFLEAASKIGLCKTKIVRVLNHYLPKRAPASFNNDFKDDERHFFLRGIALRASITGALQENLEFLIPERLLEHKKDSYRSQEIENFKQIVGAILPWYQVRSNIFIGKSENLELEIQDAISRSMRAGATRFRTHDRLTSEIARVRFQILAILEPSAMAENPQIVEKLLSKECDLSFQDHLKAVRVAYRLEHLSEIAIKLEQSCREKVESFANEDPESKANHYVDLARAVLSISPIDAAAYFDCAIEAVSKFGDELAERWKAIVAIARRSAEGGYSSSEIAYRFIRCAEIVGDSLAREKYWSRNDAIVVCSKLCPSSAFAALSRWRDRDIGWFKNQLSALAYESVNSKVISPSTGWSLSAFTWEHRFDEFATLCIKTETNKLSRQYIFDSAVRDFRLNNASENCWKNIDDVAKNLSLENREIQLVLDFYKRQPKEVILEGPHVSLQADQIEDKGNINWQEFFVDLDLNDELGLSKAIKRFDNSSLPRSRENFWEKVFERISIAYISQFLMVMVETEDVDLYDIKDALSNLPEAYQKRISVQRNWPNFFELVGQRFAFSLANHYRLEYFTEGIQNYEQWFSSIYGGILKGISDSHNLVESSDVFFGFSEILSSLITTQEASNLLEFAISRFELHIDDDYGDGPWGDRLLPPSNFSDSYAGFVWAALGSPRPDIRWQAAHCVRRLIEAGCTHELDNLIEWMNRDCANAFGSPKFPFYNLHARLYLLMALARVAIDSPIKLKHHHLIFVHHALNSLPHVLIQKFAANIALLIEDAFPGTYANNVVDELKKAGISQLPHTEVDRFNYDLEQSPWHIKGEVDLNLAFRFDWDFDQYWFKPLGGVFGISGNQIEDLAREAVINVADFKVCEDLNQDPRISLWSSSDGQRETMHSHGGYPRAEDYRFYISYHAMLSVGARLLLEMPVVHRSAWGDDEWMDWLQRHSLCNNNGRWLADRRDPAPLERRAWLLEKTKDDWQGDICSDDFLDGLFTQLNGITWMNVYGSWEDSDGKRKETFYISSALVSKETSQSLLNALSSCQDPHDFKFPAYQEESMEFDESPFKLHGWIFRASQDAGPDAADPHANKINYPPYRVGNSILEQLGLSSDLDLRNWYMPNTSGASLICNLWSLSDGEHDDSPSRNGRLMSASLEFLKTLCSTLNRELIIEVEIQRRLCRPSYDRERYDDGKFTTPNSRVFIFSADGQLRDTSTSYKLR
jgi:hypothetical protein